MIYKYILFVELMHISKASDRLIWIWNFCCYHLWCYLFCLLLSHPILIQMSKLCHFNSSELDLWNRIRIPPGGGVLIFKFAFFCLSIIIIYFSNSWRGRTILWRTVSYTNTRRRMFLGFCRVLPFSRMITIGSLVLVVSNLKDATVSSEIILMPFEYVWNMIDDF